MIKLQNNALVSLQAENPRMGVKKTNNSHSQVLNRHSGKSLPYHPSSSTENASSDKHSRSSPLQFPSQSCPSPQHSAGISVESRGKRHVSGSSHKSRKSSGSSKRLNSILLKKSSLVCQKSDFISNQMEGPSPEEKIHLTSINSKKYPTVEKAAVLQDHAR